MKSGHWQNTREDEKRSGFLLVVDDVYFAGTAAETLDFVPDHAQPASAADLFHIGRGNLHRLGFVFRIVLFLNPPSLLFIHHTVRNPGILFSCCGGPVPGACRPAWGLSGGHIIIRSRVGGWKHLP